MRERDKREKYSKQTEKEREIGEKQTEKERVRERKDK